MNHIFFTLNSKNENIMLHKDIIQQFKNTEYFHFWLVEV